LAKYSKSEIEQKIKQFSRWYQNFDLNGIQTSPGRNQSELLWQVMKPFVPENLQGKTVLDLGCNAGFFSVKMKKRGAQVLAIDMWPEAIEQANFVADVLELDIDFKQENVYEFILKNKQTFDYVLYLGLFYHLRYPLLILDQAAKITKEKFFFQTVMRGDEKPPLTVPDNIESTKSELLNHPNFPKLFFIEKNFANSHDNWFLCNESAIYALLRSSGFKDIKKSGPCFICNPSDDNLKHSRAFAEVPSP